MLLVVVNVDVHIVFFNSTLLTRKQCWFAPFMYNHFSVEDLLLLFDGTIGFWSRNLIFFSLIVVVFFSVSGQISFYFFFSIVSDFLLFRKMFPLIFFIHLTHFSLSLSSMLFKKSKRKKIKSINDLCVCVCDVEMYHALFEIGSFIFINHRFWCWSHTYFFRVENKKLSITILLNSIFNPYVW